MIAIPLYIFLFAYLFFLLVFTIFLIINFGHIFQTGGVTFTSFIVTAIILAATVFTLFFTWSLLQNVNWTDTWQITNWFGDGSSVIY